MKIRINNLGYYWPTMVRDSIEFAKKCHLCQIHSDLIHQPPEPLHPTVTSWPLCSLCNHFIFWCVAVLVDYVGDDIVIGDQKVALCYRKCLAWGSEPFDAELVSDISALEFANKFRQSNIFIYNLRLTLCHGCWYNQV